MRKTKNIQNCENYVISLEEKELFRDKIIAKNFISKVYSEIVDLVVFCGVLFLVYELFQNTDIKIFSKIFWEQDWIIILWIIIFWIFFIPLLAFVKSIVFKINIDTIRKRNYEVSWDIIVMENFEMKKFSIFSLFTMQKFKQEVNKSKLNSEKIFVFLIVLLFIIQITWNMRENLWDFLIFIFLLSIYIITKRFKIIYKKKFINHFLYLYNFNSFINFDYSNPDTNIVRKQKFLKYFIKKKSLFL